MTIVSAALAAVPSQSAMPALHASTANDSGAVNGFAEQLNGFTVALPDAGAWRPAEPTSISKSTGSGDTAATQTSLPFQFHPPYGTSTEQSDTPEASTTPADVAAPATPESRDIKEATPTEATTVAQAAQTAEELNEAQANTQMAQAIVNAPIEQPAAARVPSGHLDTPKTTRNSLPITGKTAETARKNASTTETQTAPVVVPTPAAIEPPAATDPTPTNDAAVTAIAAKTPGAHRPNVEAPDIAAPKVTAVATPQQPQDMAFAARVQPVQSVEQAALPAEMASNAAVAAASKKIVESAAPADAQNFMAAPVVNAERSLPSAAPASAASAPAAPTTATAPDSLPKFTAPLKDISLQVTQAGKESIDVRVVQQGGEVHVSVHSADASLTSGLRQGLSDLQSRLEENGYRSEMWRPGVATAPVASAPAPQTSSNNQSRSGDQQSQQGGSQQESGRRNQNQSNQPHWVEELNSSLTGGEKSSGGFYGFSS